MWWSWALNLFEVFIGYVVTGTLLVFVVMVCFVRPYKKVFKK